MRSDHQPACFCKVVDVLECFLARLRDTSWELPASSPPNNTHLLLEIQILAVSSQACCQCIIHFMNLTKYATVCA